jgi:hypothetical protein
MSADATDTTQIQTEIPALQTSLEVSKVVQMSGLGALKYRFDVSVKTPVGTIRIFRGAYFETPDGKTFVKGPTFGNPKAGQALPDGKIAREYLSPCSMDDTMNRTLCHLVQSQIAKQAQPVVQAEKTGDLAAAGI